MNHIKSIEQKEGVTLVRIEGSVTIQNLKAIQSEFASKTARLDVKNILFDLKDVSDADTSGVAGLVDLLRYMKIHQPGGKIGLVNVPQKAKDLLTISRTEPLFTEFASENEAIKSLG
jgi:anti-anti-sigma factor